MFDNAGKQIKNYAIIYVWTGTFVGAITCGIGIGKIFDNVGIGILGFLIEGLVNFLYDYVISLFMYAMGDLVNNAKEINQKLDELKNRDIENKKEEHFSSNIEIDPILKQQMKFSPTIKPSTPVYMSKTPAPMRNTSLENSVMWKCSNCGRILMRTINKCPYCETNK